MAYSCHNTVTVLWFHTRYHFWHLVFWVSTFHFGSSRKDQIMRMEISHYILGLLTHYFLFVDGKKTPLLQAQLLL